MRIMVLGGLGIQGLGILHDLIADRRVRELICVDRAPQKAVAHPWLAAAKVDIRQVDCQDREALRALFRSQPDAVVDVLPKRLNVRVAEAAIACGTPLVNGNYGGPLAHLDQAARQAGIAIIPECDFDPGADLILYHRGVAAFDRVTRIDSFCGGFPRRGQGGNPLDYRLSWPLENLLHTLKRPALCIRNGERHAISVANQHAPQYVFTIEDEELGTLEAAPNGDAATYIDALGLADSVRDAGRYVLRWPGWSQFWHAMKFFGFLDEAPLAGSAAGISPIDVTRDLLAPQLAFDADQDDLVLLINIFEGEKDGRRQRLKQRVFLSRDPESGILGMTLAIGHAAAIAATMLAGGMISGTGVLSPITDIPHAPFIDALLSRPTISYRETMEDIGD